MYELSKSGCKWSQLLGDEFSSRKWYNLSVTAQVDGESRPRLVHHCWTQQAKQKHCPKPIICITFALLRNSQMTWLIIDPTPCRK